MFDRITYISNTGCNIVLKEDRDISINLMNMHLVFEDDSKKVLGEVDDLDGNIVKARFLGEIVGDKLLGGTIRKPSLDAKIRVIEKNEIPLITGTDTTGWMKLGVSPFYDGFPVYLDVNNFFSNHFAIFGNTGSGKSCGVSRLFQNMFQDQRLNPYKANILIFDSSAEYYNAFSNLNQISSNYNYRFYSTNEVEGIGEKLRLPIYLLNKDDLALLLQCTSHSQLPIIERMLKLALVFSQNDMDSNAYKNHLIAKAIMTILYTNETAPNKRNEIFSILASCSTDEFNLEAPVQGVGYVRKFRECFLIDNSGNFTESVLLTEYVNSFIKDEYDNYEPHTGVYYDLNTLERALNFTLISEGWLRNEQTYGDSVTIRVRLHALIVGDNAKYFDVPDYISLESYLSSMLISEGRKYQIVNINLNDIDDDFAKVLTKIYSRLIFDFSKSLKDRGSIPFHIILEEAHRYIQADQDRFLFGYNIFERIAKEGRKYGVILGIITQRPVELSDNVISQCTNFLIFKINHPADLEYMRKMIPNITDEIVEKQKSLQSGTCLGFGLGFKIPLIVKMEMPNPSPLSSNCDVVKIWNGSSRGAPSATTSTGPNNMLGVNPMNASTVPSVPTEQPSFYTQPNSVNMNSSDSDTMMNNSENSMSSSDSNTMVNNSENSINSSDSNMMMNNSDNSINSVEAEKSEEIIEIPSKPVEESLNNSMNNSLVSDSNPVFGSIPSVELSQGMEQTIPSDVTSVVVKPPEENVGMSSSDESALSLAGFDASAVINDTTSSDTEEKFDDSFIIGASSAQSEDSPAIMSMNNDVSNDEKPSLIELQPNEPTTAISEISEVHLNSQGMTETSTSSPLPESNISADTVLDLSYDDDDDDDSEFGPDFS